MIVYQLIRNGSNGYVLKIEETGIILEEVDTLEPGETLEIKCIKMTEDEYKKIPEFQGW